MAIMLVVARHGIQPFWEADGFSTLGGWDVGTAFHNGWMGVDLFFVLSGFLITLHIVRRYGSEFGAGDLRDYARRRVYRIVPAYVASMAVAVSGLIPLFDVHREAMLWRIGYHLLFLQDYLDADIVVAYWSLGVEEKFYLLAPFVLMAVLRLSSGRARYAAVATLACIPTVLRVAAVVQGPGVDDYPTFFVQTRSPFHLTFDGLALGVLAALVYLDREKLSWTRNQAITSTLCWSGIVVFGALLFVEPMMEEISVFDRTAMQSLIALASASTLLGLVLGGGPIRLLSGQRLFVVGKLSYAWYLMHLMTIPLSWELANASGTSTLTVFVTFVPVYLGLSLALALGVHVAVERPFLARRDATRRIDSM
ncbi:MAG: acyltransferase [Acidimicrobiia bacterium]|nr:acyltransferase [Acidimicrobiia bacterium]